MASRDAPEGAKFTRDNLDAKATATGHKVTWKLAPNATRKGHCYYFIGTCEHCGGNAHAGSSFSSCTSVVDLRDDRPCSGPGTYVLTEIESARFSELIAPAIDNLRTAVQRSIRVKHAPGETGPVCGQAPFRFPQDFALTTDQEVTCGLCRSILKLDTSQSRR